MLFDIKASIEILFRGYTMEHLDSIEIRDSSYMLQLSILQPEANNTRPGQSWPVAEPGSLIGL